MAGSIPFTVYVEDLYWLRTNLRQQLDTGVTNGCTVKANRMFALVRDLCDGYQDSKHVQLHVRLLLQEKA
jgi:hypothetical protein